MRLRRPRRADVASLACLLSLSAAALIACRDEPVEPAALIDSVGFENGEDARVSTQSGERDAVGITTDLARDGNAAGEAILGEEDDPFRDDLGYRSEWQSDVHATAGQDYWYGASIYLPADWNLGDNRGAFDDRIIFQFHEGTGSSPALSLHLREDDQRFVVRRRTDDDFDYLWSAPFETERWYDFAFRIRWSQDDDGRIQIFLNGDLVRDYEGPTLVDGESIYTKWGIYGQPTHVIVDSVRIAEGVAGGLALVSPP